MVLPPPGHPMDNAASGTWPRAWPRVHPPWTDEGLAVTQAALDDLMPLLRHLVAAGWPPDKATHDAEVGARRFSQPPGCPQDHPGCVASYIGRARGSGPSRQRDMRWTFPAWAIFEHTLKESESSSRGAVFYHTKILHFYVDVKGGIYNADVEKIGDVSAGIPPRAVPFRNSEERYAAGGTPHEIVRAEIDRWLSIMAGKGDPSIKPVDPYVTDVLLPWFYYAMARRNNPDLIKVPGTGPFPKKGWRLIEPCSYLLQDGTIKSDWCSRRWPVGPDDERNILSRARLSHLGAPPPRKSS